MGSCVRPTPDTSTRNWARAESAGDAARAAIKVRRAVNEEEEVEIRAGNGLFMQFGEVFGAKVSPI